MQYISGLENENFVFKLTAYRIENFGTLNSMYSDIKKIYDKVSNSEISESGSDLGDDTNIFQNFAETVVGRDSSIVSFDASESFYFPLPNSIEESYEQSYEIQEINLLDSAKNIAKEIGGATIRSAISIAEQAVLRSGVQEDQNVLSTYKSSVPREFNFSWTITPNNRKEYDAYVSQITTLADWAKAKSDPIMLVGDILPMNYLSIKFLFCFEIVSLKNKSKPLISSLLNSSRNDIEGYFIQKIGVKYPDNMLFLKHDGMLPQIQLDISLIERRALYRIDWENKINNEATDISSSIKSITNNMVNKASATVSKVAKKFGF